MPIVNLTKLTIRLANDDDEVYQTFEPDDASMTVQTRGVDTREDGVPIVQTTVTDIDGLPDPEPGTYYIVPQPVAYTLNRSDLLTPDTGPSAIRNEDGTVYAVRRLYSIAGDDTLQQA
jgi:hypothetical protein